MHDKSQKTTPKISIIIPIYNVANYMALSIESVRNQTLKDIEIICVDDGSTDNSGEILDMVAALDSRIVPIHKENGGLSSARNTGIEHTSGKYICFLDSDDLMEQNACEVICETFEETDADVVTYGGVPYPEFYGYPWLNKTLSPRDVIYEEFNMRLLTKENSRPFAWRTACKAEFLEKTNIRFDSDLTFGEDQVFHFAVYPRANRTALISNKLIKYRVSREGSLMFSRSEDKTTRIKEHIQIVDHILNDWQSGNLLQKYDQEIFDWNIEFLIHDIFAGYDESEQPEISSLLSQVWRNHFSDEFLESRKSVRRYGEQVRIIMNGEERPSAVRQKLLLFKYHAAEYGLKNAIRNSLCHMMGKNVDKANTLTAKQEETWQEADRNAREAATKTLGINL